MKVLLILLLLSSLNLQARTYTFSGGNDSTVQFIAAKILQKAYSKAGIQIKPAYFPLEESLQRSNSGETDGELVRIEKITELYGNLKQVPVEIIFVEAVAFSKNTSLKIKDWNDLRGHKVTIVKGNKFIEKATQEIPREVAPGFKEALDALVQNKTEIVVIPRLSALQLYYTHDYDNIKPVSDVLQKLPLYHFVHKKNAHLIPIITPILQQMKDSGEIEYIRQTYLKSVKSKSAR